MRWLSQLFLALLACAAATSAFGGEYQLSRGDIIRGTPVQFNEVGVVFRLDVGGHSERISWFKLDQDTLKKIVEEYPESEQYADLFIIVPPEVKARERAKKRQIPVKEVTRVELPPEEERGLQAWISTPIGLTLLVVLFLANLYAGYEIALYRGRPPAVVCAVSAVLPVIGPLGFLVAPAHEEYYEEGEGEFEPPAEAATASNPLAPQAPVPGGGGGLALAKGEEAAGSAQQGPTVYKRTDTTFNRRFFETKFPGFFRVVPTAAERDQVLVVRSARGEHMAKRISRISMNELHLQLMRGAEVMVPFAEISEVEVRHKDHRS